MFGWLVAGGCFVVLILDFNLVFDVDLQLCYCDVLDFRTLFNLGLLYWLIVLLDFFPSVLYVFGRFVCVRLRWCLPFRFVVVVRLL